MRSLADLTAAIENCPHDMGRERKWELCSACHIVPCKPAAKACAVRRAIATRKRGKRQMPGRYQNLTPEQREQKRLQMRQYYAESKDAIKVKKRLEYERKREEKIAYQRAHYWKNREYILARKRERKQAQQSEHA